MSKTPGEWCKMVWSAHNQRQGLTPGHRRLVALMTAKVRATGSINKAEKLLIQEILGSMPDATDHTRIAHLERCSLTSEEATVLAMMTIHLITLGTLTRSERAVLTDIESRHAPDYTQIPQPD